MEPAVDFLEPAEFDPGVDLSGRDGGVTQHLLDGAEVGSPGEEVGGEAVSQRVRAHLGLQAGGLRVAFHDRPEADPRERAARFGDENLGDRGPSLN